jgi:hypothetical protein
MGRGFAARTRLPLVALVLATGLAMSPVATRPAVAATGRLLVSAAASYVVAPADRAVHVTIGIRVQNDKPDSATYRYYWRDITWQVQPDASAIQARDATGPLAATTAPRDGFDDVTIHLRRDLLFGDAANLTLAFDLPDGGPRSASAIRVGAAFAAFDAWAWGDPGQGSVAISMPAAFVPQTTGSAVTTRTGGGTTTLSASGIRDPSAFWVGVSALDAARLSSDTLSISGAISLVIRGWPEDATWRQTVMDVMRRGLPELISRIGLPWPVAKPLQVSEAYAPDLGGYAGLFLTREQTIQVSEQLDDQTILHEAAHVWFNEHLFTDRWIDEGLADEYATLATSAIGLGSAKPVPPDPAGPGHVALEAWTAPTRITVQSQATEEYGYNASWWVVEQLVDEIGLNRMRSIFAAAAEDQIAYVGAGAPETVAADDGWQRFLDLLQEIGGSARAEELFRTYVVPAATLPLLDQRDAARTAYAALVAAGHGWAAPEVVRVAMARWSFSKATAAIAAARAVLVLRDELSSRASALGLDPGTALERAYEGAPDSLDAATALARGQVDALTEIAVARDAVSGPHDLIATVGLIGTDPSTGYDAARAAWAVGDVAAATQAADRSIAAVADAARVGGERLVAAGGGVAVLSFGGVLLLVRRRRRLRPVPVGGTSGRDPVGDPRAADAARSPIPDAGIDATTPAEVGPYGTLAAIPPAAVDAQHEPAAGAEGGPPDSDGSAPQT